MIQIRITTNYSVKLKEITGVPIDSNLYKIKKIIQNSQFL